ncbi:MAG TPA: hypothetical protein DEF41_11305 [Desulfovibrio sp.]|uniref:Uncharacterized protein n=1 Tax=Nitratidesulfovibrio vulgaris (strain ATCC 29579 / DSM 644 / CCUG 34227 / NCIMB 8303 / VKM B-1760 / Hildenborough) TaxID=882 RepID=Q729Y9_NITV2|nr:hypothetical protein DVU_2208 [Nitratidesulfovibrio vulgaris str. Hildenborough]HBW16689.1 hypothetical protein [Desulfovibrio sp.]
MHGQSHFSAKPEPGCLARATAGWRTAGIAMMEGHLCR